MKRSIRRTANCRRTVLAVRAGGLILIGLAAPELVRGIVAVAIDPGVRRAARNVEGPAGILAQVATETFRTQGFVSWVGLHASAVMALLVGAYLLCRRNDRLMTWLKEEAPHG